MYVECSLEKNQSAPRPCGFGDSVLFIIIIIIISAHKSDLSNPWSQTQASLSIPSLHPPPKKKEEREEKK